MFECILGLFRDYEEQSYLLNDEHYFNYPAIFHTTHTTIMIKDSKVLHCHGGWTPFRCSWKMY